MRFSGPERPRQTGRVFCALALTAVSACGSPTDTANDGATNDAATREAGHVLDVAAGAEGSAAGAGAVDGGASEESGKDSASGGSVDVAPPTEAGSDGGAASGLDVANVIAGQLVSSKQRLFVSTYAPMGANVPVRSPVFAVDTIAGTLEEAIPAAEACSLLASAGELLIAACAAGSAPDHLVSMPAAGGARTPLYSVAQGSSIRGLGVGPSSAASRPPIYFLRTQDGTSSDVLRLDAGGDVTPLATVPTPEANGASIQADDTSVYVAAGGDVWRVPVAGGAPQAFQVSPVAERLRLADTHVYYQYLRGQIYRVPTTGGAVDTVTTGTFTGNFNLDGGFAYVGKLSGIVRVPSAGGALETVAAPAALDPGFVKDLAFASGRVWFVVQEASSISIRSAPLPP
jgi:hypothetical protein